MPPIDPVTGAAVVAAASQLLGGLLGNQAAGSREKRQILAENERNLREQEQASVQNMTTQNANALTNLMAAYRSALGG